MVRSTTSKKGITRSGATDYQVMKVVFAGIDFHKRLSVVTLGDQDGNFVSQHRLANNEGEVARFFSQYEPLVCAIENCRGNEWFVELVKSCGHDIRIGNTRLIRLIADSAKKNDKIDSRILMELVARNYLPVCYQPTREERCLREKLRWRTSLLRSRTKYKNIAHAILDKENKSSKLRSAMDRNRLQEQSGLSLEREDQIQKCLTIVDFMEARIVDVDRNLMRIAKENPDVQRLTTIPGVGDLSALMIFAELGDITRFRNARHVAGYIGLVPRLYASSDTKRLGRITKQGPGHLRRLLVQDAWIAVRECRSFKQRYSRIMQRRGKRTAIVAIARTIAEIAYHILRNKTEFDEKRLTLGQAARVSAPTQIA